MIQTYAIFDPSTGKIIARVGTTQPPAVFMVSYPGMARLPNIDRLDFNDETHRVVRGKIVPIP